MSDPKPEILRDQVIAGLRERGWPEPTSKWWPEPSSKWGGDISDAFVLQWGKIEFPCVWWCPSKAAAGYETGDDLETGRLDFDDVPEVTASRIIEAIDRLRWVIGLPPCAPEPYKDEPAVSFASRPVRYEKSGLVAAGWKAGIRIADLPPDEALTRELEILKARRSPTSLRGRIEDELTGNIGLPAKPEPKEEPPFQPNKFGEHD
jgi:hypothetical protein